MKPSNHAPCLHTTNFPWLSSTKNSELCHSELPWTRNCLTYIAEERTSHHGKHSFLYCCVRKATEKTSNMIATSPAHGRADCCLATSYKHSSYYWVRLREEVFIAPLPSYTRYIIHTDFAPNRVFTLECHNFSFLNGYRHIKIWDSPL
jgi:hypothetical protein